MNNPYGTPLAFSQCHVLVENADMYYLLKDIQSRLIKLSERLDKIERTVALEEKEYILEDL